MYCVEDNKVQTHMTTMHGAKYGPLRAVQHSSHPPGMPKDKFVGIHGRPLDGFTDSNHCGNFEDACMSTSGFASMHLFHHIS